MLPTKQPNEESASERQTLLEAQSDNYGSIEEGSSDDKFNQKTIGQQILDLAVPAGAALLIDPLMTLVDTAFVGRTSTEAAALAGMGSAAALLTFFFYLCNFLCTATTPLVAEQRAAGNQQQAVAVGGQALSLALTLGASLTILLWVAGQPLLYNVMGTSNTGPIANEYAIQFLTIRALAAPAVLCIEASTGVLRGFLDTKTPIAVLIGANLINFVLDVILIVYAGMGPMGAAIATTSAEWVSAALFLTILAGKLPSAADELGSNPKDDKKGVSVLPLAAIPSWTDIQPLIVASSSVFFRSLVLQLSLSAAAAMAARSGDTVTVTAAASVAAHQIGIQLWVLCSFFCDSLAAASQGLVADAIGRKDDRGVRDISKTIFLYSTYLGVFLAALLQVGSSTGWLYDIFTQNSSTKDALSEILPLIVIAQPLNALVFAADGVLQGGSQFPFQARAMALSGASAVATFVILQYDTSGSTLVHVWTALLVLQLMRGLTSLYKLVDPNGPVNILEQDPAIAKGS